MFELTMILRKLRRNHDFVTTLKTKINLVRVWIDNNIGRITVSCTLLSFTKSHTQSAIMILMNLMPTVFHLAPSLFICLVGSIKVGASIN
jgi:hypothetical protein